jgi:hypothetical protein
MKQTSLYYVTLTSPDSGRTLVLSWDESAYWRMHRYPGSGECKHATLTEALENGKQCLFDSGVKANQFFTYSDDADTARKHPELLTRKLEVHELSAFELNHLNQVALAAFIGSRILK